VAARPLRQDGAFDRITAIAAELFRVPIAIVSLVDHDRTWFKSRIGVEATEIDRAPGLCASAILSPALYEVHDAKLDARALANPLVTGELALRFYAGAPLLTRDGFNLGTLCIIAREPRQLTQAEAGILTHLATLVLTLRIGENRDQCRAASRSLPPRPSATPK
jgi:GAF domain-containing protein